MADDLKNDPLLRRLELAFEFGHFVHHSRASEFIDDLEDVLRSITALVDGGEPSRAEALLLIAIAAVYEKMEEIDDSSGNLGMFSEDLFATWLRARLTAGRSAQETAESILRFQDSDDYGLANGCIKAALKTLDSAYLQALREAIESKYLAKQKAYAEFLGEAHPRIPELEIMHLVSYLKDLYLKQRDFEAYSRLCEKNRLRIADCLRAAQVLDAMGNRDEAFTWIEKGLALMPQERHPSSESFDLRRLHRRLLGETGRKSEALAAAWQEFADGPSKYSYQELMNFVDEGERATWHERAIAVSDNAELSSAVGLLVECHELPRLAKRLDKMSDAELEATLSFVLEEASKALETTYPVLAARIHEAIAFSILSEKKSRAYPEALRSMEMARDLYRSAKLETRWNAIVERVRRDHRKKSSFIGDFEEIASGKPRPRPPTFLERMHGRIEKFNRRPASSLSKMSGADEPTTAMNEDDDSVDD